jgi:stage II sporulation protein D
MSWLDEVGGGVSGRSGRLPRRRFLLATAGATLALAELNRATAVRPLWAAPDESAVTVRVLLRRGGGSLDAPTAEVSSQDSFSIGDGARDDRVSVRPREVVTVGREGDALWFQVGDGRRQGSLTGPLGIAPNDSGGRVQHVSGGIDRAMTYRGSLEVAKSSTSGRIVLVNVLSVDEYVAGVVPREMPVSFGLEPAKVQAVAARSFALARKANSTHRQLGVDVCDAVDCQSYGGVGAEQPLHGEAVDATRGRVLLRGGRVADVLYSSTCGGHTESLARLFGPSTLPSADPMDAVSDGQLPDGSNLATDAGAAKFFKGTWESNCSSSTHYRWKVTWERRQLEEILTTGLRRLAGSSAVSPSFASDGSIGMLTGLAVAERGISGRALGLRVEGSAGTWVVQRDWTIRNLLRTPSGEGIRSSAFALELERGGDGKLSSVTAFGAGSGHGVGMCQWGSRGLAAKGRTYEAILGHYYPGATLGSIPR